MAGELDDPYCECHVGMDNAAPFIEIRLHFREVIIHRLAIYVPPGNFVVN